MGTRNLTCIVVNGEYRVAQYGQWDGYPDGQGSTALEFLRNELNLEKLKAQTLNCRWITQEERQAALVQAGAAPDSEWISMEVSEKFNAIYPQLSRDVSAEILAMVQESDSGLALTNSVSFAADSLFCEWAYVVDLDKNTFEVYKGFNETGLDESERFAFLLKDIEPRKSGNTYYPVKLVKSYSLFELPTVEQMCSECDPREEEEE